METMGDGNDGFQVTIMKWGDGGRVESFTLYTPEQRETPKVKSQLSLKILIFFEKSIFIPKELKSEW